MAKCSQRNANEKVIYIHTCFNGVAIQEWINIYKVVVEFIQVINKLWYDKNRVRKQLKSINSSVLHTRQWSTYLNNPVHYTVFRSAFKLK